MDEQNDDVRMPSRTTHFQIVAQSTGFTWRLLAANGRERARSGLTLRTVEECLGMIAWVRAHVATAGASISARDGDHQLAWTIEIDGVPVATASGFQRRHDLDRALAGFREAAPSSRVDPTILRHERAASWSPRTAPASRPATR